MELPALDLSLAEPRDIGAVTDLLTRAFHDDPAYVLVCPDEASRPRKLAVMFRSVLSMRMGRCQQWVARTPDGELVATATWTTSTLRFDWLDFLRHGLLWLPVVWGLGATRHMARLDGEVLTLKREHAPTAEHNYLAQLAVAPAHQGRGVGSEILRRTLAEQPRQRPYYLLTTTERNMTFYQRHAFSVAGRTRISDSFDMWAMTRPGAV
ncbi:MAG: GNAT family N-acetyltransferase [Myxococcales bacterium]|nr:GNAT family N-acetyltransferase [Myxococcales bacterium]